MSILENPTQTFSLRVSQLSRPISVEAVARPSDYWVLTHRDGRTYHADNKQSDVSCPH